MAQNQKLIQQAVILTHRLNGDGDRAASLMRVATLPVVLRAILTAQRAGITKFLVVVDSAREPGIRRALEQSKRLPDRVEWLILPDGTASLTNTLQEIVERADNQFLVLPGDATFHSSLLDQIMSPDGPGALALTVSDQPTGIYRFSHQAALEVAKQAPLSLRTLNELHHWMSQALLLKCEEVDERFWQPITSATDLPKAEAKLNRWLFKETDGIYARWNRKISIPISRQLIKMSITPNMVTIFTLLVSFVSGVFFALGGYVHTLIAALLSHGASILDGSDGEIARLTFEESDFGCWLETVCDDFYYVFVYAGLVIGMYRTSGRIVYPITGGLLALGMILSFITTAYQRKYYTHNQPETYRVKWREKMDAHPENFFLRFARRHHFLIHRSFLPYAILFFAIINFMDFLLFMSTLGVHLIWAITLYSNRVFRHDIQINLMANKRKETL